MKIDNMREEHQERLIKDKKSLQNSRRKNRRKKNLEKNLDL